MYVVGIGASAGGIEALKVLLKGLSPDENATYIIAQHISPTHVSLLADILSRFTRLKILNASHGIEPLKGHIYITPPNHHVILKGNLIQLIDASDLPSPKPSINRLFESLAESYSAKAIGVVLSGTGSDGASGLMAIRLAGGITIAQEPTTTEYSAMPLSAIESGAADLTLPVEEIPTVIKSANQMIQVDADSKLWNTKYQYLINFINETGNIDLSQYKQSSLKRRIDRRMAIHQIQTIDDYLSLLKTNEDEIKQFIKDIFISVTDFFRDLTAFDALAEVIEAKVAKRPMNDPFRIWVPGCATGEEAYSYAILLEELKRKHHLNFSYQIFATDISEPALNLARTGRYNNRITETIPEDLIHRYFFEENHHYSVQKFLKENILFSKHDLIKDPPFSKIDLVSCRNVLIYFNTALQEQVLMVFNFSLKSNGLLFLGQSESAQKYNGLFQELNNSAKIYRKVDGLNTAPLRMFSGVPMQMGAEHIVASVPMSSREKRNRFLEQIKQSVFDFIAPAFVVIDENNQVVYRSEASSEYLESPSGFSSHHLIENIRAEFSGSLRSLLYRYREQFLGDMSPDEHFSMNKTVSVRKEGNSEFIRITLVPFTNNQTVVFFEKLGIHFSKSPQALVKEVASEEDQTVIYALNDELISTRESLQTLIEELETSNEELQATNEEMMSTNEELQATNEELQTSNEELQSSNEELQTVNDELALKNSELNQLNTQLKRIDKALGIPIIQLDNDFRIEYCNRHIESLMESGAVRIGDHVGMFPWLHKKYKSIQKLLEKTQPASEVIREEVTIKGRIYDVRFIPFWQEGEKNGMVLMFHDVSQVMNDKHLAEKQLNIAINSLQALGDAIIRTDHNGIINFMNPVAETTLEYSRDQACGIALNKVLKVFDRSDEHHSLSFEVMQVLETNQPFKTKHAVTLTCRSGREKLVELVSTPYYLEDNSQGVIILLRDVTEKEQLIEDHEWRATHDPLTSSINRQFTEHQLHRCIEKVAFKSEPCTFMFIDLDKFKIINDTAGHEAGDEALKHVIHLIRKNLRHRDQLGRLGGDEFGLILEGTQALDATDIAEKLITEISARPFEWKNKTYQLGFSIGILALPAGELIDMHELLKDADQAMYLAKQNGGNQYVVYDKSKPFFQNANQKSEVIMRVQNGLQNQAFILALQPIKACSKSKHSGYECLMRFQDEEGHLMPDQIIPVAERYGLIKAVDLQMAELAFAHIAKQTSECFFTINLSAHSFIDFKTAERLIELANDYKVDLSKVVFEITESASISHFDEANSFIAQFKPHGAKIYLDDFGSGFSTFSYLKKLQVDGIKIDGQFIQNLKDNPLDQIMVRSIIEITKKMSLESVAEFVEDTETEQMLLEMGIDFVQGYLIEKPFLVDK